ncbi:uncharacterized protein LOC114359772 isoform X2 [Ostrinia furnacalis]|uniref:uncharacterized protein LOC114359772 isoform X2 n=1 Tax=Ostrinia furnacalis TaxID=93504 RepID=UPI00103E8F4D|nr:uncharacterized protein LOC114359772 isoform X2 [Ostrinia furnacalis]
MDSNVVFPRKLLKRFILLYKDFPCLWDKNCFAYKQKQKRHNAISKLTELVQEYDPTATRVHVLRKIESLRACVRREHKRVLENRRNLTKPEEAYVPTLWYYDLFSFVFGDESTSAKDAQLADQPEQTDLVEEDEEESAVDDVTSYEPPSYVTDYHNMVEVAESPSMSKRYNFEDESKNKRLCTEIEDEYDAIGINVAAKLRTLPQNQRILAEKLINDVLYQAQLDALNSSTVITNADPFKQDIM